MAEFAQIADQHLLHKFLDSPCGTLYFTPEAFEPDEVPLVVRHFDREWEPRLVGHYASLILDLQQWVKSHPTLAALVRIEQLIEVGRDFVARRHYRHYVSTAHYADWDDPVEPPSQLEQMRVTFRKCASTVTNQKERAIVTILARSIIEPNYETFFKEDEGLFVIVEPEIRGEEIDLWVA